MAISVAARQRLTTGLWGARKAGSFAGRAPVVGVVETMLNPLIASVARLMNRR